MTALDPARFDGRVAVVTGAGSGIGRATALRLGAEGARVACLDVSDDVCAKTAAEVDEAGGTAHAYVCDVAHKQSVVDAVAAVAVDLGPPRMVGNIAGIGRFAHSADQPLDEWQRIIDVNLTGTFLVTQACLPHLLAHGGAVVNIASTAGMHGQPYSAAYCASKGGVVMMTKSMAYEYVKRGVRFNVVAPGGIQTNIIEGFGPPEGSDPKLFYKITSLMGWGQPDEVAGLVAFLASDDARYMTGSVVPMDGGITC